MGEGLWEVLRFRWAPAGGAVTMDSTVIRIGVRKNSLGGHKKKAIKRQQESSH